MKSKIIKLKPKTFLERANPRSLLLREFIHDRLYGEADPSKDILGGYFTQEKHQVGRLREPIKFSKLQGYYEFRKEMERLYPENAWVTPCELFKPFYSYTIANFMLNQIEGQKMPLRVLEIGPGTGTFADSCLDFYKNYDLNMYRNCEYTFCEISSQLAEQCEKTMRQNHKQLLDEGRIKIYNGSIMDFDKKIEGPCFVVGLEILDNMPHDRLFTTQRKSVQNEALTHASVVDLQNTPIGKKEENLSERFVPIDALNDSLINLFLDVWNSMPEMDHITANKRIKSQGILKRLVDGLSSFTKSKSQLDTNDNNIFAPTAALCLFQQIQKIAPQHMMILADFDSFLMPRSGCLLGINAPMVTHKLKDPTQWKTYDSYLVERGHADICFPTDFYFLQHAYKHITGKSSQIYKTKEFVDQFALETWCNTQNLYNPMREEYFNTSFLVTDAKQQLQPR